MQITLESILGLGLCRYLWKSVPGPGPCLSLWRSVLGPQLCRYLLKSFLLLVSVLISVEIFRSACELQIFFEICSWAWALHKSAPELEFQPFRQIRLVFVMDSHHSLQAPSPFGISQITLRSFAQICHVLHAKQAAILSCFHHAHRRSYCFGVAQADFEDVHHELHLALASINPSLS